MPTSLQPTSTRRILCPRCERPQRACICAWVRPLQPEVEVLILQHPLEVDQAKGSARLLRMSLTGSRMVCGETFDEGELRALLYAGMSAHPVLLYPQVPPGARELPAPTFESTASAGAQKVRLVVLDATWRKSRKMLYLNPLLQALPRLSLTDVPASQYKIRKAHKPDQLSTLEAACYALMELEGDAQKYAPLLQAFDGFVAQQGAFAGLRPVGD